MNADASLHCSSMAPFDYAQIPGNHQISHGLEDGKLLEHLPDFSHQRSARYLPQSPTDSFLGTFLNLALLHSSLFVCQYVYLTL